MDLPDISTDLDTPLPEFPDPSLTPYRIAARPGEGVEGPQNVVTGWGPRRPITPPQMQGAVGLPDMSNAYAQAFQHLPVDDAMKAIQVANKFVAMRGYQSDLQSGKSAPEAWVKWAPMLVGSGATGVPEALRGLVGQQQITPYQQASLAQRKAELLARTSKPTVPKLDQVDVAAMNETVRDLHAAENAIDKGVEDKIDAKSMDELRNKAIFYRSKLAGYKQALAPTSQVKPTVNPAAPTKPTTPEQKLTVAKALRAQHPEWTKQQILEAVNQ